MSQKISEEARDALVVQLEDLMESMVNLKVERIADILVNGLWHEGYKIVPVPDDEKDDRAK